MAKNTAEKINPALWTEEGLRQKTPGHLFHLAMTGLLIGILIGALICVFRIIKDTAYNSLLMWLEWEKSSYIPVILYAVLAAVSAFIVCRLIKNPAIRLGGANWILNSLEHGSPHPWSKVLFPKFLGILLVLSCGVSVGSEGPSIQMGAAGALGLKRFTPFQSLERRFFILAGCAAGLAGAFSAPFSGICYVYEVMKEKMSGALFTFLLSAAIGVYISCYKILGLTTLLPLAAFYIPDLLHLWILLPLAFFAACVGMSYTILLHASLKISGRIKRIPIWILPVFAFAGAFLAVIFFPDISGEGMGIFTPINAGQTTLAFLGVFLLAKLIFTAFCYGTLIPAGVMVPLLCLGGVSGAIYSGILNLYGFADPGLQSTCIIMGMSAAFAASECAPITAAVLVAEMTGSWNMAAGLLAVGAMGYFFARLFRRQPI